VVRDVLEQGHHGVLVGRLHLRSSL
jgi:hypothetical protein